MAKQSSSGLRSLALVDGGINVRSGQLSLKKNQTRNAANISLELEGGFSKSNGWTRRVRMPRPIQGLMFYEKTEPLSRRVYHEMLCYNYSALSLVDPDTGTFYDLKKNITSEGKPQCAQDGLAKLLHIVDGANAPMYYNGSTLTTITWPPVYGATNSTQNTGAYTQGANPTNAGFPHDCEFYENRMWYIDYFAPGRAYASELGDTTDFIDNAGTPVPFGIPLFLNLPVSSPFQALGVTPNGLMFYESNGTGRLTGNTAVVGNPNQFQFEKINSTIGCLSPHLLGKMSDNEHVVQSGSGTFMIKLSENFQEVRPGQFSYDIQPSFDALNRSTISKGVLRVIPHQGLVMLATPRKASHLWNDRLWKFYYGVGAKAKPKTTPWMIDELFGGSPTMITDIVVNPSNNKVYIAAGTDIYEWTGTSYIDDTAIRSIYEFPPDDFDYPHINKNIKAYHINYKSTTGATIRLDHAWNNQDSGSTTITLPAKDVAVYPTGVIGTDVWRGRSAFDDGYFRAPVAGGQIGKSLIVYFLHESATEDITIYDIKIEYDLLGEGA